MPSVGFPSTGVDRIAVEDVRGGFEGAEELDPREELASIVSALKAHLLWQAELGAVGIPRGAIPREAPFAEPLVPDASLATGQLTVPRAADAALASALHARSQAPKEPLPASAPAANTPLPVLGGNLDEVRAKVAACVNCELHSDRKQTVFSRGSGSSGLCFVGEGPGAEEDAVGEPFVGPAGQLLDKMIEAMGIARDEVYVCNIVKCRPPNNRRPTPIESSACIPYLHRQLELVNPQVIVALGGTAVAGLLGITDGITRVRGKFRLYQGRIAVMPTFHPAYLLRNPAAKRQVWTDLRQVLSHMGREVPSKS